MGRKIIAIPQENNGFQGSVGSAESAGPNTAHSASFLRKWRRASPIAVARLVRNTLLDLLANCLAQMTHTRKTKTMSSPTAGKESTPGISGHTISG